MAQCVQPLLDSSDVLRSKLDGAVTLHENDILKKKDSPLMVACRAGSIEMAHALVKAGAGQNVTDVLDIFSDENDPEGGKGATPPTPPTSPLEEGAAIAEAAGHAALATMLRDPSVCDSTDASTWVALRNGVTESNTGGGKFVDPDFRPCADSLAKGAMPEDYVDLQWRRAGDIEGSLLWPSSSINSSYDIGEVGTVWWWMGTASTDESVLRGLIQEQGSSLSANGVYHVSVMKDGKKMPPMVVDDFIPYLGDQPAFGHMGSADTIWSLIMCKAFAKSAGSYKELFSMAASSGSSVVADLAGDGTPEHELEGSGPVTQLAVALANSPLAASAPEGEVGTAELTKVVAASLAEAAAQQTASAEVKEELVITKIVGNRLGKYELTITAMEDEVEVYLEGRLPSDLSLEVTDNNGTVVAAEALSDNRTLMLGGVLMFKMVRENQPYVLEMTTGMESEQMLGQPIVEFAAENEGLNVEKMN